jgi:hypothetical protein
MRKILLLTGSIVLFAVACFGQSPRVVPCIVDLGTTGTDGKHVADWQPREAIRGIFKIAPGEQIVMPFTMPADGECVGRFAAFEEVEETTAEVQEPSPGRTLRKLPGGEIEVLLLDRPAMDARNNGEKYESKLPDRRYLDGLLGVRLPAGDYFIVVSNHDPKNIPIKVFFWLGHTDKLDFSEK